jgi:hypothetical protein
MANSVIHELRPVRTGLVADNFLESLPDKPSSTRINSASYLSGEAGPNYWDNFVKDSSEGGDRGAPTADSLLKAILETCQDAGIKVDVSNWQQVNIPDMFNRIMGWYDARSVEFWTEYAAFLHWRTAC